MRPPPTKTVDIVTKAGGEALAAVGDVAVEADVARMVADGVRRFGALHVLYNNAGVLWKDRDRSVLETDGAQWDRVMAINLKSVFWVTKFGIPHLKAAGGGSIILVGSVSALAGFTRAQDAYTAAKGALIALNKSLAIQFAEDKIRSNIIHPGIIETPLQAPYLNDELREEFKTAIPLGRIGQPLEIANAALFLASDESSFMTGAEMVVDGGFMAAVTPKEASMARRIRDAALALVVTALVVVGRRAGTAAAQKQTVVIYTAIENEQITEYMKAYDKSLPNVDVKIMRLSTGDISARFMAEKDNMQADVIWGVGATNILIFKNAGLLEPYAPKGLDKIVPLFRDKDNPPAWVGIDIYMSAFCFNTEVGKKHNLPAPTSWADLTKPVYKGHVVMPNPASSGTGYLSVASILQRMGEAEGWKYLDALHLNIAEYTKSGLEALQGRGGGGARRRRLLRVRGVRDEEEGRARRDGPAEGGLGLRDGGQRLHEEGGEATPRPSSSSTGPISEEAMGLYAKYFAAVGVAGIPGPEGLPKDITKVVYPNDFDWSAKNRDRILTEWQKRYAK